MRELQQQVRPFMAERRYRLHSAGGSVKKGPGHHEAWSRRHLKSKAGVVISKRRPFRRKPPPKVSEGHCWVLRPVEAFRKSVKASLGASPPKWDQNHFCPILNPKSRKPPPEASEERKNGPVNRFSPRRDGLRRTSVSPVSKTGKECLICSILFFSVLTSWLKNGSVNRFSHRRYVTLG